MDTRPAHSEPRSLALVALIALAGCGTSAPSSEPTAFGTRPAVQIDQTWGAANGQWTFTGQVDPEGDPTDVILEIGPGPSTARRFDTQLPVVQGLAEAGPVTITTRDIPDIDEICVRFTATNGAGTSTSMPLCFPHDLPTIGPAAAPDVEIDRTWIAADGQWTFTGRIDPRGDPTDVVLEIGHGPATAPTFATQVPAGADLTDPATLTITTRDIPGSGEVCVRFTATNSLGASSSPPLCFQSDAPAASAP